MIPQISDAELVLMKLLWRQGSSALYAELMEATDAELPSIADTYASADFSGALPEADTASGDPECSADADSRTDSSTAPDAAAEAEADSDPDPDPD